MKAKELKAFLDNLSQAQLEYEIGIRIWGMLATEPRVALKSVYEGFDWSHNTIMLVPEKELVPKEHQK